MTTYFKKWDGGSNKASKTAKQIKRKHNHIGETATDFSHIIFGKTLIKQGLACICKSNKVVIVLLALFKNEMVVELTEMSTWIVKQAQLRW